MDSAAALRSVSYGYWMVSTGQFEINDRQPFRRPWCDLCTSAQRPQACRRMPRAERIKLNEEISKT